MLTSSGSSTHFVPWARTNLDHKKQDMTKNIALIAGVTGAIGSALARELGPRNDWDVYGVSRNAPAAKVDGVHYVTMDMTDRAGCVRVLSEYSSITHVFYCGRATHGEQMGNAGVFRQNLHPPPLPL